MSQMATAREAATLLDLIRSNGDVSHATPVAEVGGMPSVDVDLPADDPFWDRMKAMWSIPVANADGGARTLDEVRRMREEWEPSIERK